MDPAFELLAYARSHVDDQASVCMDGEIHPEIIGEDELDQWLLATIRDKADNDLQRRPA